MIPNELNNMHKLANKWTKSLVISSDIRLVNIICSVPYYRPQHVVAAIFKNGPYLKHTL